MSALVSKHVVASLVPFALVIGACGGAAETDDAVRENGTVVEAGEVGTLRLQVGDCFNGDPQGQVESLPVVPCSDDHVGEVYHTFDVVDAEEFPGTEAIDEQAEAGCLAEFEAFIGAPFDTSIWNIGTLAPGADSWDRLDDREVVCYVRRADETTTTGSAAGSAE